MYLYIHALQITLVAGLRLSVYLQVDHRIPGLPSCWHMDIGTLEAHSPALVAGIQTSHPICHVVQLDVH